MKRSIKKLVGLCSVLGVVAVAATGCTNYQKVPEGQVGIVRGKSVKSNGIKHRLCPGGSATDVGIDTVTHRYPSSSSPRYYDPSRDGTPDKRTFLAKTADGVQVPINAILYFHTNFNCGDEKVADSSLTQQQTVDTFDKQYGGASRTFPDPTLSSTAGDSGSSFHVFEGSKGWGGYLNIDVRPVLDEQFNDLVGELACEDLNPACAAARGGQTGATLADAEQGKHAVETRHKLELEIVDAVNKSLREKWAFVDDHGHTQHPVYLTFTSAKIPDISLPNAMQAAIDSSQAAYASLSSNRAQLEGARIDAQRKQIENQQYTKNKQALALAIANAYANGNCTSACYYGTAPAVVGK